MNRPERQALQAQIEELRLRLEEAEQTLEAIRAGEVDSILVDGPGGLRVYQLESGSNSYRVLVEAMSEGAATLTTDGIVLYANERLARMVGRPLQRVMGAALRDLVPPALHDELEMVLHAAEEGEQRCELALLAERGEEIPTLLSVNAIEHEGQRTLCLVATDLRTQKRNEELVRAQEVLRDADHRKNEFLGVLSHELRNPLTPIRNSIYLLDHVPPDGPQAARARDVIRRQTDHLARLVDDLLDVTRISHGKVVLDRSSLDLRDLIRKACDDHASTFAQGGIELRVDLPDASVAIEGDALRLSQIIGNLLQNAAKFTPRGGEVRVRLAIGDDTATLSVRDTGIGLDPQDVERLFEPFAQADRSLARTRGGLGLGLSLVKAVAEMHGGTARARSEGLGHGAEFAVVLPRRRDQAIR